VRFKITSDFEKGSILEDAHLNVPYRTLIEGTIRGYTGMRFYAEDCKPLDDAAEELKVNLQEELRALRRLRNGR
jgi:hypothetical protein